MEETVINVELRQGSTVLNKWEKTHQSNLPGLISAIGEVKGLINDYLTDLVNKSKDSGDSKKLSSTKPEEEDDSDIDTEDPLLSVLSQIKNVDRTDLDENKSGKRKNNNVKRSKRLRK